MKVLIAVVDDLLVFARTALFGSQRVVMETPTTHVDTVETYVQTLEKSAAAASSPQPPVSEALLHTGEQYFVGTIDASLYADPTIVFDNMVRTVPYAQPVRLLQLQGRWAQIRFDDTVGWILKDALCSAARDVFPEFSPHEVYTADHPQTIKLRAYIKDEFGGAQGMFPLTPEEYVYYKLLQKRHHIHWDGERSRLAGTWQRKLKGKMGIYSHVQPKTESAMEYIVDDMGYIAFVEAVFPDKSIKISQILPEGEAVYCEHTMLPEEWKELRPVFITVA